MEQLTQLQTRKEWGMAKDSEFAFKPVSDFVAVQGGGESLVRCSG